MKRILLFLLLFMAICTFTIAQNLHMVNGSSSDYSFNFDENTGVISDLFFTFGEDEGVAVNDDFVISWGVQTDPNDIGTYIEVDRQTFTDGINGYSSFVINNWSSVDLNSIAEIGDGNYLLVGIVDTEDDISETDESEVNNGMFLAADASETIAFVRDATNSIASLNSESISVASSPNPFSESVQIQISLQESSDVEVSLYDISGKTIHSIDQGQLSRGRHIVALGGESLESGMYFLVIRTSSGITTEQLIKY